MLYIIGVFAAIIVSLFFIYYVEEGDPDPEWFAPIIIFSLLSWVWIVCIILSIMLAYLDARPSINEKVSKLLRRIFYFYGKEKSTYVETDEDYYER